MRLGDLPKAEAAFNEALNNRWPSANEMKQHTLLHKQRFSMSGFDQGCEDALNTQTAFSFKPKNASIVFRCDSY